MQAILKIQEFEQECESLYCFQGASLGMGNNWEELPTTVLKETFAEEITIIQTGGEGSKSLLWV